MDSLRKLLLNNATPKQVWNTLVATSEEVFISNFLYEVSPVTDIEEMCRAYAKDVSFNENTLFTTDELE